MPTDNISNINEKAIRDHAEDKPALTDLYFTVMRAIDHSKFALTPHFKNTFKVVEPEPGIRRVLSVNDEQVCRYVDDNAVIDEILTYVHNTEPLCKIKAYQWDSAKAQKCFDFWKRLSTPIKEPKIFRWKSEKGLCMTRLPWDFDPFGETPIFNEIFGRMVENREAAMDFIGSIFVDESYRQQYLYLYSPQGGDGKGTICGVLMKILGDAAALLPEPVGPRGAPIDRFWTGRLEGLRLGVIDDLEMRSLVTSGFWKRITGNERVEIHNKNEKPYNAPIRTKFIITSNKLPFAKPTNSDKRRCILVTLSKAEDKTLSETEYASRAWNEAGAFISSCILRYKEKYKTHASISCTFEQFDELADEYSYKFEQVFDKYFSDKNGGKCKMKTAHEKVTKLENWSDSQYGEFKNWLVNVRGYVIERGTDDDGKRCNFFIGFQNLCNET